MLLWRNNIDIDFVLYVQLAEPTYNLYIPQSIFQQLAVTRAFYLVCTKTARLINLILGVASLKEEHLPVALKGKYVRTDAVKEPAVVWYYDGTASKGIETFLQSTQWDRKSVV